MRPLFLVRALSSNGPSSALPPTTLTVHPSFPKNPKPDKQFSAGLTRQTWKYMDERQIRARTSQITHQNIVWQEAN